MSPPLTGSRKDVLKCLSKMTIVMHPANTGKDRTSRNDVKNRDQLKSDKNSRLY